MRWFPVVLIATGLALPLRVTMPQAGERDRFPGFVYTSPEAIKDAQSVLRSLKYLEKAGYKEGEWDAKTQEAARDFQRDHFLRPDGRLDRDTMALLMSHRPRSGEERR
jgi:peptidoglycan hydrolase-like protein with peptidoglycan-binding domain